MEDTVQFSPNCRIWHSPLVQAEEITDAGILDQTANRESVFMVLGLRCFCLSFCQGTTGLSRSFEVLIWCSMMFLMLCVTVEEQPTERHVSVNQAVYYCKLIRLPFYCHINYGYVLAALFWYIVTVLQYYTIVTPEGVCLKANKCFTTSLVPKLMLRNIARRRSLSSMMMCLL